MALARIFLRTDVSTLRMDQNQIVKYLVLKMAVVFYGHPKKEAPTLNVNEQVTGWKERHMSQLLKSMVNHQQGMVMPHGHLAITMRPNASTHCRESTT